MASSATIVGESSEYGAVSTGGNEDKKNKLSADATVASATAWEENCRVDKDTGVTVYTDPESGKQFVPNAEGTEWIPKEEQHEYSFDGKTYGYLDKEGNAFKWDLDKKEWVKEEGKMDMGDTKDKGDMVEEEEESEEDDATTEEERKKRSYRKRKAQPGWGKQDSYYRDATTGTQLYRDSSDGIVYEWDPVKSAWFPKIDEDFMAQYQLNYGFTKDGVAEPTRPEEPKEDAVAAAAAAAAEAVKKKSSASATAAPKWFSDDSGRSTKVYVSNLPEDINDDKFVEFMSKCGMIDTDVRTGKPKVKLYIDSDTGKPKGDALCTYMKVESVELALQILDGSIMSGKEVTVEKAKFEMKGEKYDPKLKPKKLKKKELEAAKKRRDKMFEWQPDKLRGERSKRDKVIVIKNLFDPSEFEGEGAAKLLDYSAQLREKCAKFGTVRRVVVYDKNPEGVAQVFFSSATEADLAIEMMSGRLFSSSDRPMSVATWDGKTKYKVTETEEEERARLAQWDKFLEEEAKREEEEDNNKMQE